MNNFVQEREFGWTDNSEFDQSAKDYDGDLDMDDSSNDELDLHAPLARHGPVLRANPADVVIQREYWTNCAIAYLLDYLEVLYDLVYIYDEGPWAVEGALLILERWRANLVLRGLQLNFVSLWVQLHGLPLEYQYPELAIQMGHMLGVYERIDWETHIPRNIRFMRIKVRMNPWLPLIAGFMLRLDDGNRVWIQCRYERIHKVCTKCGMMGHTRTQCTYLMTDIEQLLHRQRQRIQEEFHVQYGFDPMEPHFVNELKAFYNRPQRWSTQIRFGPLSRDTGYRHRQHQQGGPPPPQPTMQSFMEAIQNDMHEANQEPPLTHHAVHTSNEEPPTPIQSPAPDNHNQHTTPPDQDHTQPVTTQSLWQPPENSNLQWADAQSTTLVAQLEVHVNSDPTPNEPLEQRMHEAGFRFETGDSSHPSHAPINEEALELHLAQFHLETTETLTWLTQTHITTPNRTILLNPQISNLKPEFHLGQPNSPGPPPQNLFTNISPLEQSTLNNWPKPITPGPMAHDHLYNPNSPLTHTTSSPRSPVNSLPLDYTSENTPTSINPKTRKRIRKEFGRLGRNFCQRLFCGLFQRELTGTLEFQDEDSIMGLEEASALPMDTSTPQDPSRNAGGLGNTSTVRQGKQIALFWKPDFFFILETRLTKGRGRQILSNWGFTGCSEVPREGLSGGLALGWTQRLVGWLLDRTQDWDVSILFQNRHFIHSQITNMQGEVFTVTFLYGHPNLAHRHLIWNELQTFGREITQRWVCIGDFNQVLQETDKLTFKDNTFVGNLQLQQALSDLCLIPIDSKGLPFTWMNKRQGDDFVMEKLDRAFANTEWMEHFPHTVVRNLPIIRSDHGPIILDTDLPQQFRHRPFRFEWMWTTHPDCATIINSAWSKTHTGSYAYIFGKKLTTVRDALRRWNKEVFGKVETEIAKKKEELKYLQENINSVADVRRESEQREQLDQLLHREEILWSQKARKE
uniref:CCHC-type domain-containing protein n=1 Tax=Fagus sylvatica TaxID=28930 RepID=A0A2N9H6E1_FAGSY